MKRPIKIDVHTPASTLMSNLKDQYLVVRVEGTMDYSVGQYLTKDTLEKLIEFGDIVVTQTGVWGSRR